MTNKNLNSDIMECYFIKLKFYKPWVLMCDLFHKNINDESAANKFCTRYGWKNVKYVDE